MATTAVSRRNMLATGSGVALPMPDGALGSSDRATMQGFLFGTSVVTPPGPPSALGSHRGGVILRDAGGIMLADSRGGVKLASSELLPPNRGAQ